ncbi:MAG: ribokinase [Verrucomicrobiota bacterium]
MKRPPRIAVLGSLNIDLTYRVPQLPVPGETIPCKEVSKGFGGKGANQAIAARRAGAEVVMIGCLGNDADGTQYLERLVAEGINTEGVSRIDDSPTGSAIICVEDSGENSIIVHGGANDRTSTEIVESHRSSIEQADLLLTQFECPYKSVQLASRIAAEAGTKVIVNPSPWNAKFNTYSIPCDFLITNELEAELLASGSSIGPDRTISERLDHVQTKCLVVTNGSQATTATTTCGEHYSDTPAQTIPVDTVGAGDTFAGYFGFAAAQERPIPEILRIANVAGAMATQKIGAQSSMPWRNEVEEEMQRNKFISA